MPADLQAQVIAALNIAPEALKSAVVLDNGSLWHVLELNEAAAVLDVSAANVAALPGLGIGLLAVSPAGSESQFEIRMLSERTTRFEDPITGSLNAAVGVWLLSEGRLTQTIIMAQGVKVGRIGQVHLLPGAQGSGQVLVAGRTHILIDGTVRL